MEEIEYRNRAYELIDILSKSLPTQVDNLSFGYTSLLPAKMMAFRETLYHRVVDLAESALELCEKKQIVPAAILGRAIMETSAALFTLSVKCERFYDDKITLEQLDEYLMKSMFGSKEGDGYSPFNIQNAVDEISKQFHGFKKVYGQTCEIVHPSWPGVQGAYSNLDVEKHVLLLGKEYSSLSYRDSWLPTVLGLELFLTIYNDYLEPLKDVVKKLNNAEVAQI
ncbi:DUF5677 domain-containing protein [Shewanella baltica]|uniref:DUF5677 domain-containing protein n=1 Tax=Shewanella baltica TaxID=62322 RepID=UPI000D1BAB45|nr:DUF5677 domain-containing protein [Shewanella baltica]AVT48737.1 hypothetical protein C8I07_13865 [Shewanella baltica]